jgi:1-deoxy-D-xylulose-5-phosphate reductoisomerase
LEKHIALIGSTGSIGTQALEVIKAHPERFRVTALTAGSNIDLMEKQISEFKPKIAVMATKELANRLQTRVSSHTKIYYGSAGIENAVSEKTTDTVLNALVGSRGLIPTCLAIENGKNIALANKESLVSGGALVMRLVKEHAVSLIPVDSEHSAVFQCLNGEAERQVRKIVLTASGGPFLNWDMESIRNSDVNDALKHPNWTMGQKITVDSATMMNKGLEIIEAAWLFGLSPEQIDVVVHPQSIIHSMVEFCDTSVIAQLGLPDMKVPIQYALTYPDRISNQLKSLSLDKIGQLTFQLPDQVRFPCLRLAKEALKIGKTMPCVLNAANDILVERYLRRKISFYELSEQIENLMQNINQLNIGHFRIYWKWKTG